MGDVFDPDFPSLFTTHLAQLRASGIGDDAIRERGYESILGKSRLREVGFAEYQQRAPGLLMPVWAPDGSNGLYQYKPDTPRTDKSGKIYKYETPARAGLRLDVPPHCRPMLSNPSIPLYVTEGIKKGDAGATHGLCVVVVMGVWGFKGRNDFNGTTWLADWQDIALDERLVNIAYDSDVMTNPAVKRALDVLTQLLTRKGATVRHVYLPGGPQGEKVGLDDFLLTHPVSDLDRYTVLPSLVAEPKTSATVLKLAPGHERHLSDVGNAYRLVALHGEDIRYCHAWGKWLVWDGQRWAMDQHGQIVARAKSAVQAIYREAAETADRDLRAMIAAWALASESAGRIKAMIELARNELPITPDELDRNAWTLNVANGTVDLRTGALLPHRREDFLTKIVDVAYDPTAVCPHWRAFLERILAPDLGGFLQRAVGYSLTGDVAEQVMFFLYGTGANGKSTFLNAMMTIFGDYFKQGAPGLLTVKSGESHPTELADLAGVRFLSTVEVTEGRHLAEALVKQLTGGDPVKARRMREDFWTFLPTHKIWLAANHKPIVKGTDYAIWRRIRLVPFLVTITDPDPHFPRKLRAEYPGILNWAVQGCLAWLREGLGTPAAVTEASAAYRQDMNVLASFVAECCVEGPNCRVEKTTLYQKYKEWCEANGERHETRRVLTRRMRDHGYHEVRVASGREAWVGVGLTQSDVGQAQNG